MKQSTWDIFLGGLLYCTPSWVALIPILVNNFNLHKPMNDTFMLTFATMMTFLCLGMSLMRTKHLEDEVERLNKKLDENK